MIELYSFPTPNGHKLSIALEELGLAYEGVSINIARGDFPHVAGWFERFLARPAVQRGLAAGAELWGGPPMSDVEQARRFGGLP